MSASSVTVLHAVIDRALKTAVRDQLLVANPAAAVENPPRPITDHGQGARALCWSGGGGPACAWGQEGGRRQLSAFFALTFDSGARKSELLGLQWSDVDLDAATVTIAQQLSSDCSNRPAFGPPKTGKSRTVTLGTETVTRLRGTVSVSAN